MSNKMENGEGESWGMRYPLPLIALLSLGSLIMYTMRFNVTIALNGDSCKGDLAGKYGWSNEDKGQVLGAFFYGYCVLQVPGGLIATRYGGKLVLAISMLGTVIFTAIVPFIAARNVTWLVLARVGCGLFQSSLYPAWATMVSTHLPPNRRNLATGAFSAGSSAGVIVAWLVLPNLQSQLGWQYCFYLPAALGAVWLLVWVAVAPSHRAPPRATVEKDGLLDEESRLIPKAITDTGSSAQAVPSQTLLQWVVAMFTCPAMWGVYFCSIAVGWVFYTLLSFLPQYMKQRYSLDLEHAASVSVIPYALRFVVLLFVGRLADWLLDGRVGRSKVRKVMTAVALIVPAAALLTLALSVQTETVAIALLVIGVGASGSVNVGAIYAPIEMYPETAGASYAMGNLIGNIPGFVSPPLTGWILDQGGCPKATAKVCNGTATVGNSTAGPVLISDECERAWGAVFLIAVGVSVLGVISYSVLGGMHPVYRQSRSKNSAVQ
eukprot:m.415463 g.415463  ORF g.415463 m.415463 type:complete len:492 (-) comp29639_c0_seq1:350-1825(-)